VVGRFGDGAALKVPEGVEFFGVHVVHCYDRVAPVGGAEGEGGGFLAVDCGPLRNKVVS
jgi:hypothetical protein